MSEKLIGSVFLSTLSLRRATRVTMDSYLESVISIHALLAESDEKAQSLKVTAHGISIHALLAESDLGSVILSAYVRDFYPRSPCGERRPGKI